MFDPITSIIKKSKKKKDSKKRFPARIIEVFMSVRVIVEA
jgi:hypothetical protein